MYAKYNNAASIDLWDKSNSVKYVLSKIQFIEIIYNFYQTHIYISTQFAFC